MKRVVRVGLVYYELEDGTVIDKGLYDLVIFLEEQRQKLLTLLRRESGEKESQNEVA